MTRSVANGSAIVLVGCLAAASVGFGQEATLGLADLEVYRVALSSKSEGSAPEVGFRDLWDRPELYLGRTVAVQGRVARIFRQSKFGEFPPLVEAWIVSPAGDPFCLVFPSNEGRTAPEIGTSVRFSGTFLKRIKYQGGDVARLAPLIVGPNGPAISTVNGDVRWQGWSSADWLMAAVASLVVGFILVGRHFSQPTPPPPPREPPPLFVDADPGIEEDFDESR